MAKRIGLIQTKGIGDIIIALPIADFYIQEGCEVFWPIDETVLQAFKDAKPQVNFIGVKKENGWLLEKPLALLQQYSCEQIIPLYSYLEKCEVYNKMLLRSLKFDEYKYAVSGVPFANKWNLVIHRNREREMALYEKLEIKKTYICVHLEGSDYKANISLPKIWTDNYQIVNVSTITNNPFDWIYTFENAAKLILIDSCFSNLVEQLNLTNEKYLILRSVASFTPVMKNGWRFMGADPKALTVDVTPQ